MSAAAPDLTSLGLIARGAQGSVLLVHQRSQRRFLALKIVRLRGDAAAARRQLAAQQAFASGEPDFWVILPLASGLGSDAPEDIAAIAAGEAQPGEWLWLLMPYVHGPNALELALGDERFSWSEVAALCAQVAARLARRPEGQAHLDLKPENILVDSSGRAFLVDRDGHAGTPGYGAPEQREPNRHPDGRADLFALGRTCQRLLCRAPPQAPQQSEAPDMLPPWPELPEELPPEQRRFARDLMQLTRELCAPEPADRGEAQEMARRLLEIAVGLGGPDLTATLSASFARAALPERLELFAKAMASQPRAAASVLPAVSERPSRRLRPALAFALVGALAAGALALVGSLALGVAYHWGWLGAPPALAEPSAPLEVDADPLGSDAFGHDHYRAEITDLGLRKHADMNHGYVCLRGKAVIDAVEILRSDESVVWRAERPKGNHRFDLVPGSYIVVQERQNPLGRDRPDTTERNPFVLNAGDKAIFDITRAPEFAPIP